MNRNLVHWSEPYPSLYDSVGNDGDYGEFGGIRYDAQYSLVADVANSDDFGHRSMPTDLHHAVPFTNASHVQNIVYLSPAIQPMSQRQQVNQQLHIDTQFASCQMNDPDSSTASSTSFKVLQTPYLQSYPGFQPSIHISSPQSASAGSNMLLPDPEKVSPLAPSPLLRYPPSFGGGMLDAPPPSIPIEPDVVTQVPMPHILEWKKVTEHCGTNDFVPQTVYQPYTEADRKRYIQDVELRETIYFQTVDSPEMGISLDDALTQRLRHLRDKDDRMFVGCGPSVSIRIQWPGYASWSKQIPTKDFKTPKGHITRAKLAKNIAACIRRFVEVVQDKPMEAESDVRWKIGERHIKVENLTLVSLHHVSKGSWQPQLRVRSPIAPFSYQWDESLSPVHPL